MTDPTRTSGSADAIAGLYAGAFADFTPARDALAKQLRAAGNRDEATRVKGLRKPSRPAWALNRVVHYQQDALRTLDDAVADLVDAHAGTGDVRTAMTTLREAVRRFATHAADEAQNEGFRLDVGDLSNAILAVLGTPIGYDELRSGRLTDIPEAGGLDFLTSLPARPRLEVSSTPAQKTPTADAAEVASARKQAQETSRVLAKARADSDAAVAALTEAEKRASSAEEQLRTAQSQMQEALQRRAFARKAKESAAAELRKAEADDHTAQRRLRTLTSG